MSNGVSIDCADVEGERAYLHNEHNLHRLVIKHLKLRWNALYVNV